MMERLRLMNRQGFTLVELALVLVIVGLLITGVLKGEALIQNAKVKKLVNQKESITAAFYTFYDRYGAFPGDENDTTAPTGDAHNGNSNGQILLAERWYLFEDLVLADIINGSYSGSANDVPNHAFGSWMRVEYLAAMQSNCLWLNAVPGDVAQQIDSKYDDGVFSTGSVRADQAYTNPTVISYWRM